MNVQKIVSQNLAFTPPHLPPLVSTVNKHKPWIETSYHGVIVENLDTVLLDPPLVALDKDAPESFAGEHGGGSR